MSLYKVVRDDYTDIYSGTFSYRGKYPRKFVHPSPDRKNKSACGAGLHACFKVESVMSFAASMWPLRLLEVEGHDEIARDDTKARFAAITVQRELPIAQAFGPNGKEVVTFISGLKEIKWFRPEKKPRKDVVERRMVAHLSALKKFKCPQKFEIEFTGDVDVAWDAARDAAHIVSADLLDFPNPWTPLMDLYRMGLWPAALTKQGKFIVWVPG